MTDGMIEVFLAKKIITMNPSWPTGTAIAVRDGEILGVGDAGDFDAWRQGDEPLVLRDDFADKVLMPGLIDPHLHPLMAAVLLPMQFITAMEWRFPWETVAATTTPEAYLAALRAGDEALGPGEFFFSWGYHSHWHGEMSRQFLDEVFGERPAVVWQRSFHEVYLNSAMMAELGMVEAKLKGKHQVDYDRGHFYENGLGYAINKLNRVIMSEAWIDRGLERLKQIAHFGGHTTLGDMAVGIFDAELEWQASRRMLDLDGTPFRVMSVPHAVRFGVGAESLDEVVRRVEAFAARATDRFLFARKVKLFTDGAFFSQLAMMKAPGYTDGHEGEWLIAPEQYLDYARAFWQAGYEIHVHCTGDLGLELAIDTLATLQNEQPRFDHGYTIEHFGFSTPEQVHRLKALGASVSANTYYLHELSEAYGEFGIGRERADQMVRLGSCEDAGILWSIHSDFPMAPAMPLHNAWVAASRQNAAGRVVAENEKASLDAALQAVTINAARILRLDDITGSLRAGKKADMVVLDQDPYEAGVDGLRDINIVATIFEGQVFPT
ncbi:MAG: amidohydrolase [Gammaproteobacteria bacterium]